jgi:hypothetical protein
MKATAELEKAMEVTVVSPANTENKADRPDPKINKYIEDINSAVFTMSLTETVEFATVNLGHNQTKAVQFANEIQERKMEALYSMTEEENIEYAMTTLGFCKVEAEIYAAHLEERKQEIQKVQDQASLLKPKDADELLEWHGITAKDLFGKGATAQLFNKPDVATVTDAPQTEVVDLSANSPEKKEKGPCRSTQDQKLLHHHHHCKVRDHSHRSRL